MSAEMSAQEKYICQICGAIAMVSIKLCRPEQADAHRKFCGANALRVCADKLSSMKYKCDACNSVSANPDSLCSPSENR